MLPKSRGWSSTTKPRHASNLQKDQPSTLHHAATQPINFQPAGIAGGCARMHQPLELLTTAPESP